MLQNANFSAYQDDSISLEWSLGDTIQLDDEGKKSHTNEIEKSKWWDFMNEHLRDIFKSRKDRNNLLVNRRDIINKSIMRGFKKFFVNLLAPKNDIQSNIPKRYKLASKQNLAERAEKLGLMNLKPNEASQNDFEELICWLGYPKITKKVRNFFNSKNLEINILSDTLSNYSHQKLYQMLEKDSFKVLLSYFIYNGKDQFMSSIGFGTYERETLNHCDYKYVYIRIIRFIFHNLT